MVWKGAMWRWEVLLVGTWGFGRGMQFTTRLYVREAEISLKLELVLCYPGGPVQDCLLPHLW